MGREERTQNGFRRYCLGRDQEQLLLPSEEEGREEAFLHRALQPPPNQPSEKQWLGQEEGRGHLRCRRQQGIRLHHQEGQRRQQARQDYGECDHEGWSHQKPAPCQGSSPQAKVPQGFVQGCPSPRQRYNQLPEASPKEEWNQGCEEGINKTKTKI